MFKSINIDTCLSRRGRETCNMFSRRHVEKLFDCFQIVKAQGKPGYKQSYFSCKTVNCIE